MQESRSHRAPHPGAGIQTCRQGQPVALTTHLPQAHLETGFSSPSPTSQGLARLLPMRPSHPACAASPVPPMETGSRLMASPGSRPAAPPPDDHSKSCTHPCGSCELSTQSHTEILLQAQLLLRRHLGQDPSLVGNRAHSFSVQR